MELKAKLVEGIGTFFLFFVIGMNCLNPTMAATAPFSIGTVLVLLVYLGATISGSHYNPAVSISLLVSENITLAKTLSYFVSQAFGVILACLVVLVFMDNTIVSENGFIGTKIFVAEYLFTFLLSLTVLMVAANPKSSGNHYFGIAIGLVVFVGICVVGPFSGAVFNPAVLAGLVVIKVISISQVGYYLLAQVLAAFTAGYLGKYLIESES
jgi:glycerol uptake facilitator-like aquaporin